MLINFMRARWRLRLCANVCVEHIEHRVVMMVLCDSTIRLNKTQAALCPCSYHMKFAAAWLIAIFMIYCSLNKHTHRSPDTFGGGREHRHTHRCVSTTIRHAIDGVVVFCGCTNALRFRSMHVTRARAFVCNTRVHTVCWMYKCAPGTFPDQTVACYADTPGSSPAPAPQTRPHKHKHHHHHHHHWHYKFIRLKFVLLHAYAHILRAWVLRGLLVAVARARALAMRWSGKFLARGALIKIFARRGKAFSSIRLPKPLHIDLYTYTCVYILDYDFE